MTAQHGPERAPRKIKPAEQATPEARRLLGRLLEQRRGQLGFTYRSDMEKASGLHWRMITDLENATRANFSEAMLGKAATAYQVTLDSMLAVLRGNADHLEPLDATGPSARIVPFPSSDVVAQLGPRPAGVSTSAIPEALTILRQLWRLARQPNPIPEDQATGEDLFGPGLNADSWDQLRTVDQLGWQDAVYSLAEVFSREKEMGLRSGSGGG